MKMKRLCALAVLLTSSLASAAGDVVANLEGQYYAGLNFGAGWGSGFIMKPRLCGQNFREAIQEPRQNLENP